MNNFTSNLFNLNDKVAVVIGAGGHLCSQISKGLALSGCHLSLLDIRIEKIQSLKKEIHKSSVCEILNIKMDVGIKKDHEKALKKIENKFGRIDILINGAGINGATPFFDISEKEWDEINNSQIKGTFFGCQVFGQHMIKNKYGSIINISSVSSGPPLSKAFTYSVSKAGIKNLTQNLGREWGNKGVRVNAIKPGFFPTKWNKKNFLNKKRINQIMSHTPMVRFGETKELIGVIIWLASDASSFVTGTEIAIDGGFSSMTI